MKKLIVILVMAFVATAVFADTKASATSRSTKEKQNGQEYARISESMGAYNTEDSFKAKNEEYNQKFNGLNREIKRAKDAYDKLATSRDQSGAAEAKTKFDGLIKQHQDLIADYDKWWGTL